VVVGSIPSTFWSVGSGGVGWGGVLGCGSDSFEFSASGESHVCGGGRWACVLGCGLDSFEFLIIDGDVAWRWVTSSILGLRSWIYAVLPGLSQTNNGTTPQYPAPLTSPNG
jgi:hypothetical protein